MGEELFDVNLNSLDMQEEAIDVAEFTQFLQEKITILQIQRIK